MPTKSLVRQEESTEIQRVAVCLSWREYASEIGSVVRESKARRHVVHCLLLAVAVLAVTSAANKCYLPKSSFKRVTTVAYIVYGVPSFRLALRRFPRAALIHGLSRFPSLFVGVEGNSLVLRQQQW